MLHEKTVQLSNMSMIADPSLTTVYNLLLLIMYAGELEHIINLHRLLSYCYDDDSQFSFLGKSGEIESLASRVINCVDDVSKWMSSNRLKVNPTKTEFLGAETIRQQHLIPCGPVTLSGADIMPSCCVSFLASTRTTICCFKPILTN